MCGKQWLGSGWQQNKKYIRTCITGRNLSTGAGRIRFSGGILHTPAPCHRRPGCVSIMWADWWSSPQVTGTSPNLTQVLSLPTCCVSSQTRGHGAFLGTGCSCRPASVLWLWGEGASFWPCEDMVWGYGERGWQGWKNNSVSRERGQDQVLGLIQLSQ